MPAYIIDTETTGIEEPEVIQLAWSAPALLGQEAGLPNAVGSRYFKPRKPITLGARAVHHILDSELEGLDPFDPLLDLAVNNLTVSEDDSQIYWIGHNIDFDWQACGRPAGILRICTLALARTMWPELESHKLGVMMYHILGESAKPRLKEAHDARADVLLCEVLLKTIILLLRRGEDWTWHQLWEYSELARIPTKMPFGKHKGMQIADLPRQYASWCLQQSDMDPYVLEAIRRTR